MADKTTDKTTPITYQDDRKVSISGDSYAKGSEVTKGEHVELLRSLGYTLSDTPAKTKPTAKPAPKTKPADDKASK